MLDPRKLRLLRELAQRETIAAVAAALSYTPSAVSQQLSALERDVGRPLLVRTGRTVRLTPAGEVLVEHTEAVLAGLERARAAVATADGSATGPVRLGSFTTAMRTLIPRVLNDVGQQPNTPTMSVLEMDPARVPDLLRDGRLDMALVHEYSNVPSTMGAGIDLEPLIDEAVYLARLPITDATDDPVRTHASGPWIIASAGTMCHTMTVRTCQAHGFEPRTAHSIDDFTTTLQLVAMGAGVALVPQLAIAEAPDAVELIALPITRHTRIAYRLGSRANPSYAAVAAALHRAASRTI